MKITDDSDHVIGYAQYTRLILCEIESATVIYETRNTHHDPSMTIIGTIAFPAPLMTPAMECDRARRQ